MRRFTMPLFTGALLLAAAARPAAADNWFKRYLDCVKFATVWCDLTREEVDNFVEGWAVEAGCGYLLWKCNLAA